MKTLGILALASALFSACGTSSGWTEQERTVISAETPLRVLTIYNKEDSLVLRTPCRDLGAEELASPEFGQLVSKLIATVTDPSQDGVGIAGPQVGISRRIIAVQRFDRFREPFRVYPNIRVTAVRGEKAPGPEGCLSIPGMRGDVMRWQDIDITYSVLDSGVLKDTVENVCGFTAVIFQHECDHLDGILYTDKTVPGSLSVSEPRQ